MTELMACMSSLYMACLLKLPCHIWGNPSLLVVLVFSGCLRSFMVALFILLQDFVGAISEELFASKNTASFRFVCVLAVVIVLPLNMLRKLKSLQFTGAMCLACMLFYVFSIVLKWISTPPLPAEVAAQSHVVSDSVRLSICHNYIGCYFSKFGYCDNSVREQDWCAAASKSLRQDRPDWLTSPSSHACCSARPLNACTPTALLDNSLHYLGFYN
jgi:hypothetical protein